MNMSTHKTQSTLSYPPPTHKQRQRGGRVGRERERDKNRDRHTQRQTHTETDREEEFVNSKSVKKCR